MSYLTWIIINTISAIAAVFLIKGYISTNNYGYLVLAMISYVVLMVSYINMLKYSEVSSIYSFMQIVQLLVAVLISIVFLKETINSNKVIGIILGLLSMYYLSKTF